MEILNGQIFRGWQEGIANLLHLINIFQIWIYITDALHTKKDEKKRAPAWCDRIIWYGNGLKQHEYTRGETKIYHRPVKAIFTAKITVIRRGKKIRNLFFSDRFEDRVDGYTEIGSKDFSWIST